MEVEEIAVVLARTSEFQAKLNDAISVVVQDAPSTTISSSRIQDLQNGDGFSELRALSSIRDALEVLAEQLESLQALQQQQRAERDAGLAEIEESRRVFLKQLKDYRGRELEIIQEALAFAGGSVPDKNELPPPGYPHVDDDESSQLRLVSLPSGMSGGGHRQDLHGQQRRNEMFGFEQGEEGSESISTFEDDEERNPNGCIRATVRAAIAVRNSVVNSGVFVSAVNVVKSSVGLLGNLAGQISGQVTGPSSKIVLIVVSTLVVLSLTDLGERRTKSVARVLRMPAHRSHQHHISDFTTESSSQAKASNPQFHGTKAHLAQALEKPSVQDGSQFGEDFPKCVVRERLELPFYQELQTSDILHGRG